MPTTSISGSADSNVDSNCRITAELSTIRTRTGVLIWSSSSPNRSISPAGLRCRSRSAYSRSSRADRVGFAGSQQPAHDAAGRGVVVDAARKLSAEILRGAAQSLGFEIAQHELASCRVPIACWLSMTLPPPNTLISMRSREQPALISSLISFSIAKLPKRADCGSSPQPPELPSASMKWFMPPMPTTRVADAGGHARAEHGHQHLVGLAA